MNNIDPLLLYSTQVGIALSVVYLFYKIILSKLTFYNINRWFFLLYGVLSFVIPFANLSFLFSKNVIYTEIVSNKNSYVQEALSINYQDIVQPTKASTASLVYLSWQEALSIIVAAGMVVMLIRFIVQFISLHRITRHAQLMMDEKIKVYHLDVPIIPFSFRNKIYINFNRHSEHEIKEIITHEMAHIRQKHFADIILFQFVLVLQWFNPFAWIINKSLRQNLEFLADAAVINQGVNRRHYQYHLLKVTGSCVSGLTIPFNFYSLKKRIIMMNKNRTSPLHLLRLVLLLPITLVIVLAFQPGGHTQKAVAQDDKIFTMTGFILDAETLEPISFANLAYGENQTKAMSDERGFYKIQVPYTDFPFDIKMQIDKDGYKTFSPKRGISRGVTNTNSIGNVEFIGLSKKAQERDKATREGTIHSMEGANKNIAQFNYDSVLVRFENFKEGKARDRKIELLKQGNQKVFFTVDGFSYVVADDASASVSEETDIVFVNGKQMTAEEVNNTIKRKDVIIDGAQGGEATIAKYGKGIFLIRTKNK